jgi:N-methylhydantoinase B
MASPKHSMPVTTLDPIQVEILRHGFLAAAEEMKMNLGRTAYNPIIYEVLDYSCGIFDRRCRTIAQADGLPGFLGHLGLAVHRVVEDVGEDCLRAGDLYLINDPYEQGTHVNDVTTVEPVFCDGELTAFVATRAHWLDIGAIAPGGSIETTDVVQEGLWLRSVRLYEEGVVNDSVWRMIEYNIRYQKSMLGDLRAQVASSRTGAARMREIVARHGTEMVEAAIEEIIRQSEERARSAVRAMRDGVYEAEGQLDDDCLGNGPLHIKVRVTIEGDEVVVDLDGTGPMNAGPVNAPYPATLCCCRIALKALTNPHRPATEGDFAPLQVIAPAGTMVAAVYPAPTFVISSLSIILIDLVARALAQAAPGQAMGGHYGNLSAYTLFGDDPDTGSLYIQQEPLYGGWGASADHDGENALIVMVNGDCRVLPAEALEARFPLRVERYELRQDSGGPGRQRGGLGTIRDLRPLRHQSHLMALNDRSVDPPWGIDGGLPAEHCVAVLNTDGAEPITVGKTQGRPIPPDTVVSLRTGGGGGCGDPLERDIFAVLGDVVAGYVSVEAAGRDYGVVIDPLTLDIDHAATRRQREQRRQT